ncbi:universal stress protein [Foetidibacter luteolus]|uniref:universal stress protein n=1 Tax=Foetidibacter luteolus TaxID=2608880 RepID=UPI00129AF19E|nr:universal stress protein [Foetidibacter luteolus]
MEKILVAFDGVKLNMPALDFAAFLGRLTGSAVTGIFLETINDAERLSMEERNKYNYLNPGIDEETVAYREKIDIVSHNILLYKDACQSRGVRCNVHRNRAFPAQEIINESRYADVIVMDGETSFREKFEGSPTNFIKTVLKEAECPVIIAPETFDEINEIVFTYDASASSIFAIKQFTYLFPELKDKKITVLQVQEDDTTATLEKYNFKEWLKKHYNLTVFEIIRGQAEAELFSYLFKKKNTFIVMGAYGRSSISRLFSPSHADLLIKTLTHPFFIAHR